MNQDAFWEAARQLGEEMRDEGIARRQAARDERNRRRRARYASTPKQPKTVPDLSDPDEDYEAFCRCHIAAPCTYCTTANN